MLLIGIGVVVAVLVLILSKRTTAMTALIVVPVVADLGDRLISANAYLGAALIVAALDAGHRDGGAPGSKACRGRTLRPLNEGFGRATPLTFSSTPTGGRPAFNR